MIRTALVVMMMASAACASTGSRAEAPSQVPTFVGDANRLTDDRDAQHWPSPPAGVHEPVSGSFEICVDRQGVVSSVQPKAPVDARVATDWVAKMKSWKHAVHKVNGQAVPYCYPIHLEVRANGAGGSARVEEVEGPVLIAPDVGLAHRLTNVDDSAYRLSLPADLDVPEAVYWGVFKICVERDGVVSRARVIKSPGDRLVPLWIATMKKWRYRPFEQNGRAVPFCHPIRLEVHGGGRQ